MDRYDSEKPCPACGAFTVEVFFGEDAIPTNSCLLLDTSDEAATFPVGDMRLGFCGSCGFLTNTAFEAAEYSQRYEETQGFSDHFVNWAKGLAQRWVDQYDLADKTVVEIGCGKGEFLVSLCRRAGCRGIGIDPAWRPDRLRDVPDRVEFIQELYDRRHAHLEADLIVCRHTLEQSGLRAEARADNVRGAFRVGKRRGRKIRGARILLFDDVITTGATMAAAARALKKAGAAAVLGFALARAT